MTPNTAYLGEITHKYEYSVMEPLGPWTSSWSPYNMYWCPI